MEAPRSSVRPLHLLLMAAATALILFLILAAYGALPPGGCSLLI